MGGRVHREGERVPHGLVKPWVGAIAVLVWLVPVLQEIVYVSKFVMNGHQLIVGHINALFDPDIKKHV